MVTVAGEGDQVVFRPMVNLLVEDTQVRVSVEVFSFFITNFNQVK